ncbi:major facilitator superfamily domain-containing protein [Radiomyces spectabilis]|uniref:major facilitator superfamily domain-containing protein n=1 Tax=Radiomyces spectabilis TaxID=64574 RepID=UPI00221EE327|nr:major facilitator superfamily domain-containing protein [Radiomyces spectabilis]KAI8391808.1 major facilitator superfamily domain-containing protein [Radiomyces spectabilis]
MGGVSGSPIDSAEEKALVRRLDRRLLLFVMFGNLVKTLDNTNLANAFISGMEEELNITGVQYNWMVVMFMIGYLVMQIPSNMLLSRLRPSIYLPAMEFVWCVLTLSMACVQSVRAVCILRFLLGLAEAGFYPGIVFLISNWYTKQELGKRNSLLAVCGALGGALSGLIQAGLLKTMDGTLGISGWRWMFIFDGTITAGLVVLGYLYLPDYPNNTQWLSDKYLYLFVLCWASLHLGLGPAHVLGIVAKKLGYSAISANLFTTPDMIITMICGLCNGFVSDRLQTRLWCILVPAFFAFIGCSLLSVFVQPFGFLYVAFILAHAGLSSTAAITMTWASEILSSTSLEVQAMALAIMNTSSSLMFTWAPIVLWPVTGKS